MTRSSKLASNAIYLAILTLSNYLLGLMMIPFLSRVLSVEAFGLFGFSMALAVLFQVVVEFGFMISATAQIARFRDDQARIGEILATTMLAKMLLLCACILGFVATAVWLPMVRDHAVVVGFFVLSALIAAMLPDFYFRGVERMRSIAIRAVTSKSLGLAIIVSAVRHDEQLVVVPLALAFGNAVALILGFVAIHGDGVRLPQARFADAIGALRSGAGFFASRVAAGVNQSAGAFVLGLNYAPASIEMGQFAGAARIASAGEMAVVPVSDTLYPHMILTGDYAMFRRVYLRGLAFWFMGCLVVFIWADEVCTLLLGASFAPAGDYLRILVVGTFMAFSSNLFGYPALTPLGLAQHANIALVVSGVLSVALYLGLWLGDRVNVLSVCAVMAASNFIVFSYRIGALALHRRRRSKGDRGNAAS